MNTIVRVKVTRGQRGTMILSGDNKSATLWLPTRGNKHNTMHKESFHTVVNQKDTPKFLKGAAALRLSGGVEVVRSYSLV